jgi:hypothetical protein
MKIVTYWQKPQCPECKDFRVDKRFLDFTPNTPILNDVYVCMECGEDFILQTPSLNFRREKVKRHKWSLAFSGYAEECLNCGFISYKYQHIKRERGIQILQGGFPIGSFSEKRKIPPCNGKETEGSK